MNKDNDLTFSEHVAQAIDITIASISPRWGIRRALARQALAAYEATKPSRFRKITRDSRNADAWVREGAKSLREQARVMDGNLDLATSVLNTLVDFTVGPKGVMIEPQPKNFDGEIDYAFADQILSRYEEFCEYPEITGMHSWSSCQRILSRTWHRDGEAFGNMIIGPIPGFKHKTDIPFVLELFEPDYVPDDYDEPDKNIRQGIKKDKWGRPETIFVYKYHPGDIQSFYFSRKQSDFLELDARNVIHLFSPTRLHQTRGVSVFAPSMVRIADIGDYETSERIAAKIASHLVGIIRKGDPGMYTGLDGEGNSVTQRSLKMAPGILLDDLLPGENAEILDSKRPNPNLVSFRDGQVQMVCASTGTGFSSVTKNYRGGSYSSQRQELSEGSIHYSVLVDEVVSRCVRPVYKNVIKASMLSAKNPLKIPNRIDPTTLFDALYQAQGIPWIDPQKEAKAGEILENAVHESGPEIIRKRGRNPREVLRQQAAWLKQKVELLKPMLDVLEVNTKRVDQINEIDEIGESDETKQSNQ